MVKNNKLDFSGILTHIPVEHQEVKTKPLSPDDIDGWFDGWCYHV